MLSPVTIFRMSHKLWDNPALQFAGSSNGGRNPRQPPSFTPPVQSMKEVVSIQMPIYWCLLPSSSSIIISFWITSFLLLQTPALSSTYQILSLHHRFTKHHNVRLLLSSFYCIGGGNSICIQYCSSVSRDRRLRSPHQSHDQCYHCCQPVLSTWH